MSLCNEVKQRKRTTMKTAGFFRASRTIRNLSHASDRYAAQASRSFIKQKGDLSSHLGI